jgi:3-phosphoshikimate 1-carboxyvinyltransferase
MTIELMRLFGVQTLVALEHPGERPKELRIICSPYRAHDYLVEPDASNATYFMAAAAALPGARVTVPGLGRNSLQGDVGFGEVLEKMGAAMTLAEDSVTIDGAEHLRGIEIDMSGMPDAAMTLAALAVLAEGPTTVHGLHTLRVKETDRLTALETELRKLGAETSVDGDTLRIEPPREVKAAAIDTYDDHRMAMSFAVVGTTVPGITIRGAECVGKTYPRFFEDLERLRAD